MIDRDDPWWDRPRPDLALRTALLDRLQAGATLDEAGEALGLDAIDLIAGLALSAADPGPPGLLAGPPRRPWLARALAADAWTPLFPDAPPVALLALAAGLLQMHDFWDEGHESAQDAGDRGATSPYWHAIAHRREPDPGNAAYWFRHVGRHPLFPLLAARAGPLIGDHPETAAAARIIDNNTWDPFAFIDLCTREARHHAGASALARDLQWIEMFSLLRWDVQAVTASRPRAPRSGGP